MIWKLIKSILCVLIFIIGLLPVILGESHESNQVDERAFISVLMPLIFFPIALPIMLKFYYGIIGIKPLVDWPQWNANIFDLRYPIKFFHFSAFICLSFGIGHLISSITVGFPDYLTSISKITGFIGVMLGIYLHIKKSRPNE